MQNGFFRSVHHALVWSFSISSKAIISQPGTYRMRGPAGGVQEFTEHERHAQAAQVIGNAERALGPIEFLYCEVRWGRRPEWAALGGYLLTKTGIEERRRKGVDKIVRRWRGEKIGEHAIRYDLRCRQADVSSYRRLVFGVLEEIHDKVLHRLEFALNDVIRRDD
jgi:hypothetical protein